METVLLEDGSVITVSDEEEHKILRRIAEDSFTWGELNPKYEGQDSTTGNIFCCFHPNYGTPAAKFYEDEERDIMVLWCFRERRFFTVYDYITLILVEEQKQAKDAKEWLIEHLGEAKFNELYKIYLSKLDDLESTRTEERIQYIRNLASELDSTTELINALYLELE